MQRGDRILGHNICHGDFPIRKAIPGYWKPIITSILKLPEENIDFCGNIRVAISNEKSVKFWQDSWLSNKCLKDHYPSLYSLEKHKSFLVGRILQDAAGCAHVWDWKSAASLVTDITLVDQLQQRILNTDVNKRIVIESLEDTMKFSLVSLSRNTHRKVLPTDSSSFKFTWCKLVPLKVNLLAWRALHDRLPTRLALCRRNVSMPSTVCVLCREGQEDTVHLFTGGHFSDQVWQALASWCHIPGVFVFSVDDITNIHNFYAFAEQKAKAIYVIFLTGMWCIWIERNLATFNHRPPSLHRVISEIKALSFLWFSEFSGRPESAGNYQFSGVL
ncbi:hypothetical protein SSX86_001681 [Deinandra increscens subsp. villosa]|uniref:Reverse transcriptase zinc-binding domain-containing protein n=1 Tax=Deinandra increscens subsp. villosa TaxID=3103831 RepID=A0AAP0DRU6_9ASTR